VKKVLWCNRMSQGDILKILERQKVVSVKELSKILGISEQAIRRNLRALQKQYPIKRKKGIVFFLSF
jgi:DeoR/GlpR family transcriptional regulator of sugar metabolism